MKNITYPAVIILSLCVVIISPFVGIQEIGFKDIFADNTAGEIFRKIRLPRVLMSFIAGCALSAGGVVFQAMFKNPIATPFTLGVSSGASLGAAIYFFMGFSTVISGFFGGAVFALAGALLSTIIVYLSASAIGRKSDSSMLLVGVALNFLCSGLIMFIQYSVDLISANRIMYYMIGSLSGADLTSAMAMLPPVLVGCVIIITMRRELDLLAAGEETAAARGVNTGYVSAILYFTVSVMIGCVVSLCGPIGFVGMMAPHICRLLTGASNMKLTPIAIIFGGAFLTICDTAARVMIAPSEMPVGIITSLLGAPFFIFLIIKNKKI